MRPLLTILGLWRGRAAWLLAGAVVALLSALSGVALLALAGAHVAVLLMGAAAAAGALLVVLGPIRVVLRYLERLATHAATFRALADLRVWLFRGIAARSAGGLGMRRSGDLAARLVADVEALDGLYLRTLVPVAIACVLLPGLLVVLVVQGGALWAAGLAACVLFAGAAFAVPALAARAAITAGGPVAATGAALRTSVLDSMAGLREIRAFGAEDRVTEAVAMRDGEAGRARGALARRGAAAQVAGFLCAQAAILILLLAAPSRPVFATAAIFLLVAAFEAVSVLPRAGALAGHAAAAARRVLDAARPTATAVPASTAPMPAGSGLQLQDVGFTWVPDQPAVFDHLSLEVPAGARVAVLGPSGSGKSTLSALLLGVVAPQSGQVMLGGADIATLPPAALRARFTVLSQATHLFDDTIRANLLLGQSGVDDPALWQALETAEVAAFVRSLPDGLDTWLGEGGSRVSGGQGRRIALARALLSSAPILLLDEPTSGLDAGTEQAFLRTLNALPPGRTLLLVTHRLTGVEVLDRIWRLSGGRAVAAAA